MRKRILTEDDRKYLEGCADCKVSFTEEQELTDEQKQTARDNIGVTEVVEEAMAEAGGDYKTATGHYFGTGTYCTARGSKTLQYPEGCNVLSFDFIPLVVDVWRYKKCTFKFFDDLYYYGGLGRMDAPYIDGYAETSEWKNAAATMDHRNLRNLKDARVYWGFDDNFHYLAADIITDYIPWNTVNGNAPWIAIYFDHNGDGVCKSTTGYPGNWNCTNDNTCVAFMYIKNNGFASIHYLQERTGSTAKALGATSVVNGKYIFSFEVKIPRSSFTSGLDAFINNPDNNGKGLPFQILTGFVNAKGDREITDIPCEFILHTGDGPAPGQRAIGYGAKAIEEGEVGSAALDNRLLYNPNTGKWDLIWLLDEMPDSEPARWQLNGDDQGKTFRYVARGLDAKKLYEQNGWNYDFDTDGRA